MDLLVTLVVIGLFIYLLPYIVFGLGVLLGLITLGIGLLVVGFNGLFRRK